MFQQTSNKFLEAYSHINLGLLFEQTQRFELAETELRKSLALLEPMRSQVALDAQARAADQISFVEPNMILTEVLLAQHTPTKNAEAFAVVQQIKSRALLDLSAGKVSLAKRISREEQTKLRTLQSACDRLNTRLVAEGVTNETGSRKRADALRSDLAKAERTLSVYTDLLYARYPEAAVSRVVQTATTPEIVQALPSGTALIEFATVYSKNELWAFVTTRQTNGDVVRAYKTPLPRSLLTQMVADLRDGVSDPRKDGAEAWKTPARVLYEAFFAPLEKEGALAGVSHLVICPTGVLWDVPFAALLDGANRPLLARFTLTQAQSATLYLAARARAQKQKAERAKQTDTVSVLAVADPAFAEYKQGFGNNPALPGQRPLPAPDRPLPAPDRPLPAPDRPLPSPDRPLPVADRALLLPEALRGTKLASLPGTRQEADAIRAAFPQAAVFIGGEAQEGTVKALAPKCRFVHLATHGFVNDTAPLLSALVFAEPPKTGKASVEDGFLTARELLDLDLSRVELVTLSACNTARGKNQAGEGILGLTWALFAAGCPTQVLSQWAVNDASTATLMEQFYANLKAGQSKAAALRQAALFVAKQSQTAHPYYWAPFVLFGSGE